jgi:hypothetical protein
MHAKKKNDESMKDLIKFSGAQSGKELEAAML